VAEGLDFAERDSRGGHHYHLGRFVARMLAWISDWEVCAGLTRFERVGRDRGRG
jgi:hypothetical protein